MFTENSNSMLEDGNSKSTTFDSFSPFCNYSSYYYHYKTDMYNPVSDDERHLWDTAAVCVGAHSETQEDGPGPCSDSSDGPRTILGPSASISSDPNIMPISSHYQTIFPQFSLMEDVHFHSGGCSNIVSNGVNTFMGVDVSGNVNGTGQPFVRVVKRRNTANKKERRRTQSINNAYADLRDCIPNVPADTKLSKIKTLRLAGLYISYLKSVLETNAPDAGFRAELENLGGAGRRHSISTASVSSSDNFTSSNELTDIEGASAIHNCHEGDPPTKRGKSRTGWPQHVWALEFKQE